MIPAKAERMIVRLMKQHGLDDWSFRFVTDPVTFGACWHEDKTITVSLPLTKANTAGKVRNVILHEIAHALVGNKVSDHGYKWRRIAKEIGCDAEVFWNVRGPAKMHFKWTRHCPSCEVTEFLHRRSTKQFCRKCSNPATNDFVEYIWSDHGETVDYRLSTIA